MSYDVSKLCLVKQHKSSVIVYVDMATLILQTEQSINISWVDPNESNRLYLLTVVNMQC